MRRIKHITAAQALLWIMVFAISCSDSSVAGTIIETNTGNKVLIETNTGNGFARIFLAPSDYGMSVGDTLIMEMANRNTVNDTVFVYGRKNVADLISIAKDEMLLDSVALGVYDTLEIHPVEGDVRSYALIMEVKNSVDYRLENSRLQVLKSQDDSSANKDSSAAQDTVQADTLEPDTVKLVYDTVSVVLPDDFAELADIDESFKDMPFPIRLAAKYVNPCAYDMTGEKILLEKVNDSLYWGKMSQVIFSKADSIDFAILDNCKDTTTVELSRRTVHMDGKTPSEAASARFPNANSDAVFGTALWTDSTDQWLMIEDFVPFTNDGNQMSASIWIKADSVSQPTLGKNYTRILSARRDSVGVTLQQRGNQAAVNLRIDARKDGVGVYNSTFGNARILDGTWHNYAFTVRGDSVFTYADGAVIGKTKFENGSGFASLSNPAIGYEGNNFVGGLDEIFFFDGSQTENWMRLFYALQKQALK